MAIEVAYVGTYSDDVDLTIRQDILPAQLLEPHGRAECRSSDREQQKHHEPVFHRQPDGAACLESRAVTTQLAAQALFTSPTIQKNRLLRPYP